jgi:hypothetical protein
MSATDIRKTIMKLEAVGMEYVANRDFKLVKKAEKNGVTYALGSLDHDYDDNTKSDYSVYKLEREDGFEYNNKFYPQEFYSEVESLKLSPYVKPQVALDSFKSWLSKV